MSDFIPRSARVLVHRTAHGDFEVSIDITVNGHLFEVYETVLGRNTIHNGTDLLMEVGALMVAEGRRTRPRR